MSRKNRELVSLFGADMVSKAQATDVAGLSLSAELMDAVHDAADRLLTVAGRPEEQRRIVSELPSLTRLVLCMWIMDMELAARLTAAVMDAA